MRPRVWRPSATREAKEVARAEPETQGATHQIVIGSSPGSTLYSPQRRLHHLAHARLHQPRRLLAVRPRGKNHRLAEPHFQEAVAKVGKVNTNNRKGKTKRARRSAVRVKLPDSKRAIVTLVEGEIEIFQAG